MLSRQLARARVREDALDQLPPSSRAGPELVQNLGRRRLLGALLQHRHEDRDPGEGLAQVVRDDVRVRLQLGLHPPLLAHVVEEDDHAVAELRGAVEERAEHVAVAERRVVRHLVDERATRVAHLGVGAERLAAPHRGQRLEERVAIRGLRGDPEAAQHRGVAVLEREVDDPARGVAYGPQDADGLGEPVEQPAKARGAALAEHLDELRVLAPGLRLEVVGRRVHARRIRPPRSDVPLSPCSAPAPDECSAERCAARGGRRPAQPAGGQGTRDPCTTQEGGGRRGEPWPPPPPCARHDSNVRPLPPQGSALSLSYGRGEPVSVAGSPESPSCRATRPSTMRSAPGAPRGGRSERDDPVLRVGRGARHPADDLAVERQLRVVGGEPVTGERQHAKAAVGVAAMVQARDRLLAGVAALREADRALLEPRSAGITRSSSSAPRRGVRARIRSRSTSSSEIGSEPSGGSASISSTAGIP